MFGLGFPELLIILVIILVIFGAGKLPQVGEALGKGLNKFRTAMDDKSEKGEASGSTLPTASTLPEEKKEKEEKKKI